jgi:hypothetical protein
MLMDALFDFGLPTITNSTAGTVSTNVFDALVAKKLFQPGQQMRPKVAGRTGALTADANGTVKIDLVGADSADLATNPVVLGSTGVLTKLADGATDIGAGSATTFLDFFISTINQQVAKRYYGLVVTLGGTNPDMAAGGKAALCLDAQTNMVGPRAAVPA